MKLKYFIYSICLAVLALYSCQKEDDLENLVDLSSPYVLDYLKDSQDPIDQRRYEIYQTYGVAVFLHDKVSEVQVGTDYKGDPIYKTETLDISWDFYTDPNADYSFTYLQSQEGEGEEGTELTEEEKSQELADVNLALDYVETYLSMAGETKPFSILLLDRLYYSGKVLDYYKGFRTLYIGNAASYPDPADMRMRSGEIINSSVLPLVQLDEALCKEFETISEEKHYYRKQWKKDLGETYSSDLNAFVNSPFYLKLSYAFDESNLETIANNPIMSMVVMYYNWGYGDWSSSYGIPSIAFALKYNGNVEAVKEVALELVAMAAKYGFIGGGWTADVTYSPTLSEDVETYVAEILKLGAGGMEERYGAYPLVMEKFKILKDYIQNKLGVDLNYNNI
ncbi:MAG: hypothetical protein IJ494_00345 [Bacteroides sp.]|nr:hypothetical protein [Bacteroides sp.]